MKYCLLFALVAATVLGGPWFGGQDARAACSVLQSAGSLTAILSWNNADLVDPVVIFRSATPGGPYSVVGSVVAGIKTFTDTVPKPNQDTTYYYIVKNHSAAAGDSDPSNEACKSFFAVPPSPTNLTAQ